MASTVSQSKTGSEFGNKDKKKKIRKNLNEILGPESNKQAHLCTKDIADYFDTAEEKQYATSVMAGSFKTKHNEADHVTFGMTPREYRESIHNPGRVR